MDKQIEVLTRVGKREVLHMDGRARGTRICLEWLT